MGQLTKLRGNTTSMLAEMNNTTCFSARGALISPTAHTPLSKIIARGRSGRPEDVSLNFVVDFARRTYVTIFIIVESTTVEVRSLNKLLVLILL